MKLNPTKIRTLVAVGLVSLNILTLGLNSVALAQGTIGFPQGQIPRVGPGTVGGLVDLIRAIVRWIYIIFFVVAVAFVLIAAFRYLFAAGDPEKVKGARNMIIYAAVAFIIAFLAVGFEQIIGTFLMTPSA